MKIAPVIFICTFIIIAVLSASCLNDKFKCEDTYYSITIKPFLYTNCSKADGCHNSNSTTSDFAKYSEVYRSKEEILRRIALDPNDDKFMPKGGAPLSAADAKMLKDWIDKGAQGCDNR